MVTTINSFSNHQRVSVISKCMMLIGLTWWIMRSWVKGQWEATRWRNCRSLIVRVHFALVTRSGISRVRLLNRSYSLVSRRPQGRFHSTIMLYLRNCQASDNTYMRQTTWIKLNPTIPNRLTQRHWPSRKILNNTNSVHFNQEWVVTVNNSSSYSIIDSMYTLSAPTTVIHSPSSRGSSSKHRSNAERIWDSSFNSVLKRATTIKKRLILPNKTSQRGEWRRHMSRRKNSTWSRLFRSIDLIWKISTRMQKSSRAVILALNPKTRPTTQL